VNRLRGRAATAAAIALATIGLAGCSGGPVPERTIELDARFSRFTPATFGAEPGTTVKIVVRNLDPIAHELIIGDAGVHERHEKGTEPYHPTRPGEMTIPAGETRATTYTFGSTPGEVVEFGCHVPGHWAYGMRGTATITVA
jgi:uncharacterized cupredoxin-like copper-binding protein